MTLSQVAGLLAGIAAIAAAFGQAPTQTSSIQGRITDPDGNPVPNALVQLKNSSTRTAAEIAHYRDR
jgi:hypothetical protein